MATTFQKLGLGLFVVVFCCLFSCSTADHPVKICNIYQIYQFGDSISDVGNLITESPVGATTPFARLPYGETVYNNVFDSVTGRCSNGLIMIDYIAWAFGLDFMPPYKNMGSNYGHGVNFAVAGATALPSQVLATKNISSPVTNSSLNVQLNWMFTHFDSICVDDRDCIQKLQNALFVVGEIGWNDYNYAISQGKTLEETKLMVPEVVDTIMDVVKKLINFGATKVVIPGFFPIGCLPIYKTAFQTNISEAYDENHCLKELNDFAMYHNEKIQEAIQKLKQEKPNAIIAYGDYYNAYQDLIKINNRDKQDYGWDEEKACCGIGGKYNFNITRMCGADPDVPVCRHPEFYIHWDGVHLTQTAYETVVGRLLNGIFADLQCQSEPEMIHT